MGGDGFFFAAKEIRRSGIMLSDFACRIALPNSQDGKVGFYQDWLAGYLANTLSSFAKTWVNRPMMGEGVLRIAIRSAGEITAVVSRGMFGDHHIDWPKGVVLLPDFDIVDSDSFLELFEQAQIDVASIMGVEILQPFELTGRS